MVTWGANTTATFAPGTTAATGGGGFAFGTTAAAPPTPTAAAPAPAFGASAFGAAPAPATTATPAPAAGGGLFGSSTIAPTPAPATGTGFGFGATPTAATPAAAAPSSGFGFGATTAAPAAGGGLFGSTAATPAAPATSGFGFGTTAAAPAPFGSPAPAFGAAPVAAAQQPQQQQAAPHITQTRRQEAARLEGVILSLHAQYSPTVSGPNLVGTTPHHAQLPSSQCRFQYVFYDPMTTEQRQARLVHGPHHPPPRPSHVDARTWADAVARNPDPDEYAPVVTVGAEALATRLSAQKDRSTKLAGYATQLRDALSTLTVQADKSDDAVRAAQIRHGELRSRLLRLMRRVEILRCTNLPLQPAEREAAERIRTVRVGVDGVGKALADVEERGRHHVHALRTVAAAGGAGGGGDLSGVVLSEQGKADMHNLLMKQKDGLDELSTIVTRDLRDAKIAKEELTAGGGGVVGGGNVRSSGMGMTFPGMGQRPLSGGLPGPYR